MDFKYIMQDVTHVYIGARYTYRELIEAEDVPFKIKKMINQYIEPELHGEDLSIESHFYYMDGSGFAYQTFLQLKTLVFTSRVAVYFSVSLLLPYTLVTMVIPPVSICISLNKSA